MNAINLTGPARTLALTLRARAEEHNRPDSQLLDPVAAQWWAHIPRYEDFEAWYNPPFQLATVIRAGLIDSIAANMLGQSHHPLVVELGAGLSTRWDRLGRPACHWIELDLPPAIAVRRELETETEHHRFLAATLTSTGWLEMLPEADPEQTLFIADGVAMFLQPEQMANLLQAMRQKYPRARFAFDVVRPHYIARLNKAFSAMDAPVAWTASPEELPALGMDLIAVEYLLLHAPERWQAIGVAPEALTAERSGFVVDARLQAMPS